MGKVSFISRHVTICSHVANKNVINRSTRMLLQIVTQSPFKSVSCASISGLLLNSNLQTKIKKKKYRTQPSCCVHLTGGAKDLT